MEHLNAMWAKEDCFMKAEICDTITPETATTAAVCNRPEDDATDIKFNQTETSKYFNTESSFEVLQMVQSAPVSSKTIKLRI
jgi:hypothetical protein